MAIQVPTFSVPTLSPAGLLDSGSPEPGSFDSILEQTLAFVQQRRLQSQSEQAAMARTQASITAQRAMNVEDLLAQGHLQDVESFSPLPGESPLPTVTVNDREFYRGADIARRLVERTGGAELGEGYAPGTRVRDVFRVDEAGNRIEISPQNTARFRQGDPSALLAFEPPAGTDPAVVSYIDSVKRAIRGDSFLTEYEQAGFEQNFNENLRTVNTIADTVDQWRRLDRQEAGAVSQQQFTIHAGRQLRPIGGIGEPVDMTPSEARVWALRDIKGEGALTPAQRLQVNDLERRAVPRVTAIDVAAAAHSVFLGSGQPNNIHNIEATNWLQGLAVQVDERGVETINPRILADLRRAGVSGDKTGIVEFFTNRPDSSAPYRAAFALEQLVGSTRSSINRAFDAGLYLSGFNVEQGMETLEKIYGDRFNDVPAVTSQRVTAPAGTAALTADQAESAFLTGRQAIATIVDELGQPAADVLSSAFNTSDASQAVAQLNTYIARNEDNPLMDSMRDLVDLLNEYPGALYNLRDSTVVPGLRMAR